MMAVIIGISILDSAFSLAQPVLMGMLVQQVEQQRLDTSLVWVLVAVVAVGALLSGLQLSLIHI
mgnify:CR=1 FL=1